MANIMVVDDERDVVTLIRFILENEGHVVQEAYNGEEALQKLAEGGPLPDVIVLDVMMPIMDGYTTSAKLREKTETRSIPLLILTAKGKMRDVFEMSPNVAAYIEKPFDPKTLRDTISKTLSRNPRNGPDGAGKPGS